MGGEPQVRARRFVLRVAEVGLSVAIGIAVLAFGGTSPPLFLFAQVILFGLGAFFVAASLGTSVTAIRFPWIAPVLLLALVLTQLLPLHGHTLSVAPYQTVSHLLLLVTYLTAFYLVLLIAEDRNRKKRLVYTLVALGAFEAFYGLVQYLTGWQQIFAYVKKYYLEEATGTYINRNHFAGFLEMVLPFTVVLALYLAGSLRHRAQHGRVEARDLFASREFLPLVFLLFLAVVLFTALVFSRSRMGIISALASLLVVLGLAGSSSLSKRTRVVAAVLFLLGVVAIVVWVGSDPVLLRFETLGQEYNQTRENRISVWVDTLQLIHKHPWTGTGLGTFSVAYTSVQTVFFNLLVDHAHCDYLEVTSDLGVPGGLLVFGSIFWVLARAVRSYRKAQDRFDAAVRLGSIGSIVAILLHSFADFNLYIPANALVFAVALALALTEGGRSEFATSYDAASGSSNRSLA